MKGVRVCLVGCVIAIVLLAVTSGNAQSKAQAPSGAAKKFVGMWRLVSYESSNQETTRARGPRPNGLIAYDASGHMSAQIMPDRARLHYSGPVSPVFFGPQPTPAEALDAVTGYTAYFGTYTVDPRAGTITHHRQGNLNQAALGDFVRRYTFIGDDRVSLVPLENQNDRLLWERVK